MIIHVAVDVYRSEKAKESRPEDAIEESWLAK